MRFPISRRPLLLGSAVALLAAAALGFADTKISSLTAYGTQHGDDLFVVVDTHDQTMGPTGTDKRATTNQVFGSAQNGQLIGWSGGASGTPVGITLDTSLSLAGNTLSVPPPTIAIAGDVAGSGAGTINVTYAAIGNGLLLGNTSGQAARPVGTTLTGLIDGAIGSTRGSVLYRGAASWSALGPGSSGQVLTSGGAAADPSWQPAGGGTITLSGAVSGSGTSTITTAFAGINNNTLLANTSGSINAPVANTVTGLIDSAFGNQQGSLLYRGATAWSALAPGSNGQVLTSAGPSADPSWQPAGGGSLAPAYSQTTPVTVTASGAASLVNTTGAAGSTTLSAGALNSAGRTLRIRAFGYVTTAASGPGQCTLSILLGGSVVATTPLTTFGASKSNFPFSLDVVASVASTGATGTINVGGHVLSFNGATNLFTAAGITFANATAVGTQTPGTPVTLDLTSALAVDLQLSMTAATNSFTLTGLTVEIR